MNTNNKNKIGKMIITGLLFVMLVMTMGAMDSYYFSADQITSGTLDSDRLNINVLESDSLIEGANITLDTSEAGVVVITAASGGGGITKTDVQNMPVDTTDIFWDTSEVDTIRAEINTDNFPEFISFVEGNNMTIDTSEAGIIVLNSTASGDVSFSDFVETIGLKIDTSETGLAYFDIDYTVIPSLSSFVDSDSVTWDTSETGVMIATATAPSFSTETYLNIMSSNVSGICQNLKGLWGMTGTTTALEDLSYAINPGTLEGGLTFATDRSAKNMGYTTLFNGTSDYIDLGDSDDFSFGNGTVDEAFSICALVNVDHDSNFKCIITRNSIVVGDVQKEWQLSLNASNQLRLLTYDNSSGAYIGAASTSALSEGYHFVVATFDASGALGFKLYVDGVEIADTPLSYGSYTAMENLDVEAIIGGDIISTGAVGNFFNSYISFVALEKSEMTASEVFRLWKLVQGVYGL